MSLFALCNFWLIWWVCVSECQAAIAWLVGWFLAFIFLLCCLGPQVQLYWLHRTGLFSFLIYCIRALLLFWIDWWMNEVYFCFTYRIDNIVPWLEEHLWCLGDNKDVVMISVIIVYKCLIMMIFHSNALSVFRADWFSVALLLLFLESFLAILWSSWCARKHEWGSSNGKPERGLGCKLCK